jgi:hypothetical protein
MKSKSVTNVNSKINVFMALTPLSEELLTFLLPIKIIALLSKREV